MATKAIPYVALYNWSGFYVGGNIGYGWGRFSDDAGAGTNPNGVIGGGQIGYNWPINSLVLGLEADIQASGQRSTSTGTIGGVALAVSDRIRYFAPFVAASVTPGIAGWSMPRAALTRRR